MIRNRILSIISAVVLILALTAGIAFRAFSSRDPEPEMLDGPGSVVMPEDSQPQGPEEPEITEPQSPVIAIPESAGAAEGNGSGPAPQAPELTWIEGLEIPEYSGQAYVAINGNVPFFDTEAIAPVSYEIYYQLDDLGRCTLADAVVGQDIMASGKR